MAACSDDGLHIEFSHLYVYIHCIYFRDPSAAGTMRMNSKPTKPLIMGASTMKVHKTSALRAIEATMKLCNVYLNSCKHPHFMGVSGMFLNTSRNMARTKWWHGVIVICKKKNSYILHVHCTCLDESNGLCNSLQTCKNTYVKGREYI